MKRFEDLDLKPEIKLAIKNMGFEEATPIQEEIIPHVLAGSDCLAQAPTGTGKTCAFGIPVANMVEPNAVLAQALILCPTRELAMQTEKEMKKLVASMPNLKVLALFGGQSLDRQLAALRKKPQIIVGTPGRVIDHLRRRTLKLHATKMVVLDEADEMLDMGFRDDIDAILSQMPGKTQTLLFSATMSKEIMEIVSSYQENPVSIKTTVDGEELPPIKQYFVRMKNTDKYTALKEILDEKGYGLSIVFCNTKSMVDELSERLSEDNYEALGLHGDLRQRVRDKVMRSYRAGDVSILVATDVAARGIDVSGVEAIFNYDVPMDEEYYVHRIGRTARAKKTGVAYSFVTQRDIHKLNFFEKLTGSTIEEFVIEGITESKLSKSGRKESNGDKYFFNVGQKDGLDEQKMKKFVVDNTKIQPSDIVEIKLLDIFSFVTVKKEVSAEILCLKGLRYCGRKLNVEISNPPTGNKNGGRGFSREGRNYSDNRGEKSSRSFGNGRNRQDSQSRRFGDDRREKFEDGQERAPRKEFSYDKKERNFDNNGERSQSRGRYSDNNGERSQSRGRYSDNNGERSQSRGRYSDSNGERSQNRGRYSESNGERSQSRGGYSSNNGERSQSRGGYSSNNGERSQSRGRYSESNGERSQSRGGYSSSNGERGQSRGGYSSNNGERSESRGRYSDNNGERSERRGGYTSNNGESTYKKTSNNSYKGKQNDYRSNGNGNFKSKKKSVPVTFDNQKSR